MGADQEQAEAKRLHLLHCAGCGEYGGHSAKPPRTPLELAVAGLRAIWQEGKVCDQYESCLHLACSSSYAAWAIADSVLRSLDKMGVRG